MKRLLARAALKTAITLVRLVRAGGLTGGHGYAACDAEESIRFFLNVYYK